VHPVGEPEGLRGPWRQQQRPGQGAVRCSGGISFTSASTPPSRSTFGDLLEGSSRHVLRGPPYDAALCRAAGIFRFQLQGPTTASPPRTPCEGRGQGPEPRRYETAVGRVLPAGLVHQVWPDCKQVYIQYRSTAPPPLCAPCRRGLARRASCSPAINQEETSRRATTACCVSGLARKFGM
jgi:hypothetical protein